MTTIATTPERESRQTVAKPAGRHRAAAVAQWTLVAAALTTSVVLPLTGFGGAVMVSLLMTLPFAAIHGVRRYGWQRLLTFFVVTYAISNAFENLSISTGFPFGHYHYTGDLKLFQVPFMIGIIYFGLGYVSWLTASTLLDRADERLNWHERAGRVNTFALPAIAAAVMTMFDVATDAQASTVGGSWIWERGGGVFGVPYTNYLGWWLVTYTFFQVFALLLARTQTRAGRLGTATTPGSLLQPVLLYASAGLTTITAFMATDPGTAVDATGVTWDVSAINETAMTVGVFTVLTVAALALIKIARGDT